MTEHAGTVRCEHVFISTTRSVDGFYHCVDCGAPMLELDEAYEATLADGNGFDDE